MPFIALLVAHKALSTALHSLNPQQSPRERKQGQRFHFTDGESEGQNRERPLLQSPCLQSKRRMLDLNSGIGPRADGHSTASPAGEGAWGVSKTKGEKGSRLRHWSRQEPTGGPPR